MLESLLELAAATGRCAETLDDWGVNDDERRQILTGGIGRDEPGASVALETRLRHIVDVDRSVAPLVGFASVVPVWLRLPQDALTGLSPLEFITAHPAGLHHLRQLLVRERLERFIR